MSYPYDLDVMLYETYLGVSLSSSKGGGGGGDFDPNDDIDTMLSKGFAVRINNYLSPDETYGARFDISEFADYRLEDSFSNAVVGFKYRPNGSSEDAQELNFYREGGMDDEPLYYALETNNISGGTDDNDIYLISFNEIGSFDWNLHYPLPSYLHNNQMGNAMNQETGKVEQNGTLQFTDETHWVCTLSRPLTVYNGANSFFDLKRVTGVYGDWMTSDVVAYDAKENEVELVDDYALTINFGGIEGEWDIRIDFWYNQEKNMAHGVDPKDGGKD